MPEPEASEPAPLVTIAIPTYNRAELLRGAIAAVRAQTHPSIHLVVCDNGSTDGTEALVRELLASGQAIEYIRQPSNLGPTANFTTAGAAARGDYFMWYADDDWIPPEYVERCLAVHRAHPGAALVAGVPRYGDPGTDGEPGVVLQITDPDPARRVAAYFRQVQDNGTFYGLIRTDALEATSPLMTRMGADWMFVAELAALGPIRTAETTTIWRDFDPGYTWRRMAKSGGLTWFEGRLPYVAIMGLAARTIAVGSPVFRTLGARRHLLAARAATIVFRRFVITGLRWRSLRRRMWNTMQRLSARTRRA